VERLTKILEKWYSRNKRDLPWRKTKSAYAIWLSEILLQQTTVNQGIKYYENFLARFPDVWQLAKAPLEDVLKAWQGLGYYTRARNLHVTARIIVQQYNGIFPADYDALISLKGIGEYTAAAVASIAFHIPVAVVDGNVYRVLARIYGVKLPATSSAGKNEIRRLATALLNKKDPGNHNQALMELGALICLPKNPSCSVCPVNFVCHAYKKQKIKELPVKTVKTGNRKRYFHYLHISWEDKIFIRQRTQKDIWHSLFELPLIETRTAVLPEKLFGHKQWKSLFNGSRYNIKYISPVISHQLTHQTLHACFYFLEVTEVSSALAKEYICIDKEKMQQYPVSRLTEKALKQWCNYKNIDYH